MRVKVKIKRIHPEAVIPSYAKRGDAGFDLSSVEDVVLCPGERALVKTGLSIAVPIGYELQVRPRSGLALKHGITVLNSPGTVDSGYRGEIGAILINHSNEWFHITKGMRIAQGVVSEIPRVVFEEVKELPKSERGTNGFGSSGIHGLLQ